MTQLPSNLLRRIDESSVLFDAWQVPEVGVGSLELSEKQGGVTSTRTLQKCFSLSFTCKCIVLEMREFGPSCPGCVEAIAQEQLTLPEDTRFTPEQINWAAKVCSKPEHNHACQARGCSYRGCAKHVVEADNGRRYCLQHVYEIDDEINLLRIEQEYGLIAAKMRRFHNSISFSRHLQRFR